MTAFRVRDPQLPARESPGSPAERHVSAESVEAVVVHTAYERAIEPRAPPKPDMTIGRYVTPIACLAGFRSMKRQRRCRGRGSSGRDRASSTWPRPTRGPSPPGRGGNRNTGNGAADVPIKYVVVTGQGRPVERTAGKASVSPKRPVVRPQEEDRFSFASAPPTASVDARKNGRTVIP